MAQSGSDRSIAEYAAAVASGSPTPGGGSVAATVGALAAALGEMVCNLTLSGKSLPERPEVLAAAAISGQTLRKGLLELAEEDELAYAGYQAARAMPRSTEHEKRQRRLALEAAIVRAADIPLAIAISCADILRLLLVVAHDGTKHALSDLSTALLLAVAAAQGALTTVRVNADLMRTESERARYLHETAAVELSINDLRSIVFSAINAR